MSGYLINQIFGSGSQENRTDNEKSNATSPEFEVLTESGGNEKVVKRIDESFNGSKGKSSALDTVGTEIVQ